MFALIDCNTFYASCERVFRPDLADKPVAVLSNNDGCIVARSSEAKALNIPMGAPYYKYKKFCDKYGVNVFSSNYVLYGDLSNRVMEILSHFCPQVEQYSIDEAFLNLDGIHKALTPSWSNEIINTVKQWTGIPVSIGIAPTKTLAKIANHKAKADGTGFFILTPYTDKLPPAASSCMSNSIDSVLAGLPLTEIWGVSRRSEKKLNRQNIWNALDLKNADPLLIREKFNIVLERTVRELKGEQCIELELSPKRKNIMVSRSFGKLTGELKDLEEAVSTYAAKAAEKLRNQKGLASALYVYLRTNRNREDLIQYNPGIAEGFIVPTSNSLQIITEAKKLLGEIYREGPLYQKAGVMLLDIVPESAHEQQDLFGVTDKLGEQKTLMKTLDHINKLHGRGTLTIGSQGLKDTGWKLRCEHRSPAYTTRWEDLPKIK